MNTIEFIKSKFLTERIASVDKDYLEYELNFAKKNEIIFPQNLKKYQEEAYLSALYNL